MNHKIFISYAREDYYDPDGKVISGNIVQSIEKVLTDNNHSYWIDRNINGGKDWLDDIIKAIKQCKIFIIVLTENAGDSHYVACELKKAIDLKKEIIPIKAVSEIPEKISFLLTSHIEYIDYINSPNTAITKLTQSINIIFDDSLKKLEDLLEASKKERNELDGHIARYCKFQEILQKEIEIKKKEKEYLEYEISVREESIALIRIKEKSTEVEKDSLLVEIANLQRQIEALLTSKANSINTNSANTDVLHETIPIISDIEDLKDNSKVSKPIVTQEENIVQDSNVVAIEKDSSVLEENDKEDSKLDFSEGARKLMMGYFKVSNKNAEESN